MTSLILRTTTRFMLPLLLLFSVFLLLRGHNEPGGGFSGGLVAASAFGLFALAFGVPEARLALRFEPRTMIGFGLIVALASSVWPLLRGLPLMAHQQSWTALELSAFPALDLGGPLWFDVGVYIVVIGVMMNILFSLAEQ
jgi:multicomponent Na+:H+ antiporter subunit B